MYKLKSKNNRNKTNKTQSSRNKPNKNHIEINKIEQSNSNRVKYTKVEYCPMITNMLKKNNKKIKSPIIFSFIEYMDLQEKLYYRTVCKQWNDIIKTKCDKI